MKRRKARTSWPGLANAAAFRDAQGETRNYVADATDCPVDKSTHALSESLKAMGIEKTPENIANKISRGKFTAVFLIQCMETIGCSVIHLDRL